MGEMRNAYSILVEKRRCRWDYNIRMEFRKLGWEVVDSFHLAQDRD
jgi:hypothetical protein